MTKFSIRNLGRDEDLVPSRIWAIEGSEREREKNFRFHTCFPRPMSIVRCVLLPKAEVTKKSIVAIVVVDVVCESSSNRNEEFARSLTLISLRCGGDGPDWASRCNKLSIVHRRHKVESIASKGHDRTLREEGKFESRRCEKKTHLIESAVDFVECLRELGETSRSFDLTRWWGIFVGANTTFECKCTATRRRERASENRSSSIDPWCEKWFGNIDECTDDVSSFAPRRNRCRDRFAIEILHPESSSHSTIWPTEWANCSAGDRPTGCGKCRSTECKCRR